MRFTGKQERLRLRQGQGRMTSRIIDTEQAREMLRLYLDKQALPFTVEIVPGKHRTNRQNEAVNG